MKAMEVYTLGKRWAGAHQITRTRERPPLERTAVDSLALEGVIVKSGKMVSSR
jgi:hypothetical protein